MQCAPGVGTKQCRVVPIIVAPVRIVMNYGEKLKSPLVGEPRILDPLRHGRLVVAAALLAEFQFVISLLAVAWVMGKIERRSLGDYGLPGRDFLAHVFGKVFYGNSLRSLA